MYAIVNTVTMPLTLAVWTTDVMGNPVCEWQTIDAIPGTIINLIVYDGTNLLTLPDNTRLAQVSDTAQIGDTGY